MKDNIYKTGKKIVKMLNGHGFIAYFAGGWVRDKLLGINKKNDIDIATNATPDDIKKIFSPFANVIGVGEHFGVMLVVMNKITYEIATFRTDREYKDGRHPDSVIFSSPNEDAKRRDFTVNGMFYDPVTDTVIDYVNGREDLRNRIIRTIGNPDERFKEDYLRLLRAIRFSAALNFKIEKNTFEAIKRNASGIEKVSKERIFQEITKIISGKNARTGLLLLQESGLLKILLPELHNCIGVEQPEEFHPEGDVFTHTIMLFDYLENPSSVLAWSALLHDIGKPVTMTIADRIRFNNHHRVSANMAKDVLLKYKAPKALINDVYECIDNHMNFMNVTSMRVSTLKRFLSRPTIKDELLMHKADCMASHGDISNYNFLLEKLSELKKEALKPEPLIKGRDLIALGLKPGPLFKEILNKVYDLQLEDEINTKQEAYKWVIENYCQNL